MKTTVINLNNFKMDENILDVSAPRNSVIPQIIKNYEEYTGKTFEKEYITWKNKSLVAEASSYDYAVAFFAFNKIYGKKNTESLIKYIRCALKNDGILMVWDAEIHPAIKPARYLIKVILPGGKSTKIKIRIRINPFREQFYGILKLLKKNGFVILNSRLSQSVFYIEAKNVKEGT